MKIVTVIPVYGTRFTRDEQASLIQYARILGHRETVFVAPEGLDCSCFLELLPTAHVRYFSKSFFTSVSAYSHLLMTPDFYAAFSKFDYMLLYQLDAWVFRDELAYWCSRGYDYIGGPFVLKQGKKNSIIVGNGGFSLRKISAMLRVLGSPGRRMFPPKLLLQFSCSYWTTGHYVRSLVPLLKLLHFFPNTRGAFLCRIRKEKINNEDMVFYFLSKKFTPDGLVMPDAEEAALFSLDAKPEQFFRGLPFGCHAWRKNSWEFWKEHIRIPEDNGT